MNFDNFTSHEAGKVFGFERGNQLMAYYFGAHWNLQTKGFTP